VKRPPVITLLTDFGTADYFVAAVKAVILTSNPLTSIVDITHEIPPQDIEAGAFTLLTCYRDFPKGTIHVAVIDPGVGSTRRAIVVKAGSHYFVGPDNGLFSYVFDNEPKHKTFQITNSKYFREAASLTFHGRDLFAPVAAALAEGVKPSKFGPRIEDEVRLAPLAPNQRDDGKVEGRIINIDRFGNCVTNFTRTDLPEPGGKQLSINGREITAFRQFYADEDGSKADEAGTTDEIFAIWGSAGFLELSVNGRSAAELLQAKRGDPVIASA
jgi:S-adenosylmethionine hydrolase